MRATRLGLALALAATAWAARGADAVHRDGFDPPVCGNGVLEPGEACDDGGTVSDDGCDARCALEPACADDLLHCAVECAGFMPPAGFVQGFLATSWTELAGAPFPAMDPAQAIVPHADDAVFLGAARGLYPAYTSVRFTVPDDLDGAVALDWAASRIPGAPGQLVPSTAAAITIRRCPGDFRVDIANPIRATELGGCASILVAAGAVTPRAGLMLTTRGPSSDITCALRPGATYYLNYTNANPLPADGGVTPGEWTCPDDGDSCGVELRARIAR
jgi:cysteine-rich repeat protein